MTARKKAVAKSKSKTAKKVKSARPASKRAKASKPSKKKVAVKKTITKKKVTAAKKPAIKRKAVVKPKKISIPKPDTSLSCHICGKEEMINFEHVWNKSAWPRCCDEGMHIEDSSIKIGEVMNKAWSQSGGYAKSINLAV